MNSPAATIRQRLEPLLTWPRLLLLLALLATATAQLVNIYDFPSYREDEGTYISQAWSVINLHRLAPYTYWYDHAPVGWFIIAGWMLVTGDTPFSGILASNGRIFMVVVQLISATLIYAIAERLTRQPWIALLAVTLYAFSPINIVFHRQVLLDNIMILWILATLYMLTKPLTLRVGMVAALYFGLAVLSKETALIAFPWLALLVVRTAHPLNRRLMITIWVTVALLVTSVYPLLALLKGEFFPSGTRLGGANPHVSLIDALQFQLGRGRASNVETETFWYAWRETWGQYGAWLIVLGALTTLYHLSRYREPWLCVLGGMAWTFMVFIVRGQILDWYIIPLFPLFALSVAFLFADWPHAPPHWEKIPTAVRPIGMAALVLVTGYNLWHNSFIFTSEQTKNQIDATEWVRTHLLGRGVVLIDNYPFVDLNRNLTDIAQAAAHYYWKVDTDPEIKNGVLGNDWNAIDYMLFTPAMVRTMNADQLYFVQQAYKNSHIIQWFRHENQPPLAYPIEIREVNNANGVIRAGWRAYRDSFVTPEGRIVDRPDLHGTTSEAQSYALLRAVWENDQTTFDRVWRWTEEHMKRPDNELFGWLYTGSSGAGTLQHTTATDADEDIALALLFAAARWEDVHYTEPAKKIIADLWEKNVVSVQGQWYLTSGADNKLPNTYLINPSYISPASYRIFATIDPGHDWAGLADDSYVFWQRLSTPPSYLIPNWTLVTTEGEIRPLPQDMITDGNMYGYDAFRGYWRAALDAVWFETPAAKEFLASVRPFFETEWAGRQHLAALYTVDGRPQVSYDDISTYAGALAALYVTDPEDAIDLYTTEFWPKYRDGFWGDKTNYYNQNWAWFATALYANNVPNLWSGSSTSTLL